MWIKLQTKEDKKILRLNYKMYKTPLNLNYTMRKGIVEETSKDLFSYNNLDKYEIYKCMNEIKELKNHIPHTEKVEDYNQIINFMKKYEKVVLKPIEYSINRTTYLLEVIDDIFTIIYRTKEKMEKLLLYSEEELKKFLLLKDILYSNYIIQRYIKLTRIEEQQYDVRITMRKNYKNDWEFNSIQYRVGKNKFILKKVSNSRRDKYIKKVLKKSLPVGYLYDKIMEQINLICIRACKTLLQRNPYLCEIEFDVAIGENKRIWIIDVNFSNNYKLFKEIEFRTYYAIKYPPVLYTASFDSFISN